jgi:hypothetical protein
MVSDGLPISTVSACLLACNMCNHVYKRPELALMLWCHCLRICSHFWTKSSTSSFCPGHCESVACSVYTGLLLGISLTSAPITLPLLHLLKDSDLLFLTHTRFDHYQGICYARGLKYYSARGLLDHPSKWRPFLPSVTLYPMALFYYVYSD